MFIRPRLNTSCQKTTIIFLAIYFSSQARGPMAATILDGNKIAADIRAEVAAEVKAMSAAGIRPGLAVVLVGNNPASEIYVRGKVKSCEELGIYSEKHTPPDTISTAQLLELVQDLNRRDEIDGILVQLPLPSPVDSKKILMAAIGRAAIITPAFVGPGATVIDVGMNKVTDPAEFHRLFGGNAKREETFRAKGSTLVGDVHPRVAEVAGAMTPVPGGVGPLTIAMLMANTLKAAKLRRGAEVPALSRA